MKNQQKAYIYALLAIGCWSTIGSAFKITLRYTDPAGMLLTGSLVAALFLLGVLVVQRKTASLTRITWRSLAHSAFAGLLNPFLYYIILLKAYDILPAQMAGTLNYIWPLALVLLSVPLLKQRISIWSILAIIISFSGIILISTQPDSPGLTPGNPLTAGEKFLGIALAVGSALFWALYWILNIRDNRDPAGKLFLNFSFGFIYTLVYILITGTGSFERLEGILGGIYIGLFEMGITFVLWMKALKFSSTTAKVSNLIYLSPFISLIFIHFLVGEQITIQTTGGLALIVGGIIFQQYLKK